MTLLLTNSIIIIILAYCIFNVLKKPLIALYLSIPCVIFFGIDTLDLLTLQPENWMLILLIVNVFAIIALRPEELNFVTKMSPYSRRILLVAMLYGSLGIFIGMLSGGDFTMQLRFFFMKILRPLLLVICIIVLIKNVKYAETLLNILFICCAITATVAIFQMAGIEFFWGLREKLGLFDIQAHRSIVKQSRPSGLAGYFIELSGQLGYILPVCFAFTFYKNKSFKAVWAYNILSVILLMGLIVSLTRSAITASVLSCCAVLWLSTRQSFFKKFVLLSLMCISLVCLLVFFQPLSERFFNPTTGQMPGVGRIYNNYIALQTSFQHPFGQGIGKLSELYVSTMPTGHIAEYFEAIHSPHNQYMNTILETGYPGFFLLIWFYVILFQNLFRLKRLAQHNERFYPIIIGMMGALLFSFLNSFFHNGGILRGDFLVWYFIGLMFFIDRHLATSKESYKH